MFIKKTLNYDCALSKNQNPKHKRVNYIIRANSSIITYRKLKKNLQGALKRSVTKLIQVS